MYNKTTCPQLFKMAKIYRVLSTMSQRSISDPRVKNTMEK